jgi:hypothetical protein
MRTILAQRVASTNVDRVGERLSRSFLEKYANALKGSRQPLHDKHDMARPTVGFVENYRLESDDQNPGEWVLLADVHIEDGVALEDYGGFSISGVEMIHEPEDADARLLIAYPHYSDHQLVIELCDVPGLDVGKWIRKGAEDFQWGVLIGSLLAIGVTPIWDDLYKRKIAPRIDELLEIYLSRLQPKGVGAEVVQQLVFKGSTIEVRFIPERGSEATCLRSEVIATGLRRVVEFLTQDRKSSDVGVRRIVVFFHRDNSGYELHRIEYADGTVEHAA